MPMLAPVFAAATAASMVPQPQQPQPEGTSHTVRIADTEDIK